MDLDPDLDLDPAMRKRLVSCCGHLVDPDSTVCPRLPYLPTALQEQLTAHMNRAAVTGRCAGRAGPSQHHRGIPLDREPVLSWPSRSLTSPPRHTPPRPAEAQNAVLVHPPRCCLECSVQCHAVGLPMPLLCYDVPLQRSLIEKTLLLVFSCIL